MRISMKLCPALTPGAFYFNLSCLVSVQGSLITPISCSQAHSLSTWLISKDKSFRRVSLHQEHATLLFFFVLRAILFQFSYFVFSLNYKCHPLRPPLRPGLIIVYYVKSLVDSTCPIVWYIEDWWHQNFYYLSLYSLHYGTIDSVHLLAISIGMIDRQLTVTGFKCNS